MSERNAKPANPDPPEPEHADRSGHISLYSNVISVAGFLLLAVALLLLLTFALFSAVSPPANPYVDIIGYLILPGIFAVGLVLVPVGVVLKWLQLRRRASRQPVTLRLPRVDLNRRRTRVLIGSFLAVSLFVVLPVLGVSSYYGYHYTESSTFCGQVCHSVMEPEATAHARSPHARVSCAACHIGTGASWFVKSKLSGTRQVIAVWRNSYRRPIPPAITELRPARETCEECHWPAKFFGSQLMETVHYSPDEHNTRRRVRMLLKTGGADETIGRVEGIHMHMALAGRITYVAEDSGLQKIPWVTYISDAGEELIFRSDGKTHSDPRPEGIVRQIDCMDCHNRGAHHFRSPQKEVDLNLDAGKIDATLPFIKREAVAALMGTYPDVATAERSIENTLTSFYQINYPDVWNTRQASVQQAIDTTRRVYRLIFFPEMKVDWRTYPENVGHLESPGCLRCHDGQHVDQHGVAISSDCVVCHTFINPADDQSHAFVEGRFRHSLNMVPHDKLRCDQCHTGGALPLCRDCHKSGEWLEDRGKGSYTPQGN